MEASCRDSKLQNLFIRIPEALNLLLDKVVLRRRRATGRRVTRSELVEQLLAKGLEAESTDQPDESSVPGNATEPRPDRRSRS